jgi:hypothetical protein
MQTQGKQLRFSEPPGRWAPPNATELLRQRRSVRSMGRLALHLVISLALVAPCWLALSDEPAFRAEVAAARNRYLTLENRRGSLSGAEEKERLCLLGQLTDHDPVFAVTREVVAQAQALQQGSSPTDRATAEKLEELAAITTGFENRATTLAEAKSFANVLRGFVARRDVEGARAWAKAQ